MERTHEPVNVLDGKRNYDCRVSLDEMESGARVTMAALRQACTRLFADTKDDVLFYFSGHGTLTRAGGYLCANDSQRNNWGIPMHEIVEMANNSKARDVVMILDCCHGGSIGDPSLLSGGGGRYSLAVLRENMTIIASPLGSQASYEAGGHGAFTAAAALPPDSGGPTIFCTRARSAHQHLVAALNREAERAAAVHAPRARPA